MRARKARSVQKEAIQVGVQRVYRDAIFEAAERIFADYGFDKAKMIDIARAAGLAAGTLYNYFESKEQIFRSLIEHRFDELHDRLAAILDREKDARATLEQFARSGLEYMEQHRPMFTIFLQMGLRHTRAIASVCGERAIERHEQMRALFEAVIARGMKSGLLRRDIDVADLTAIFGGSMNGLIEAWMNAGAKGRLADRAAILVDAFLNGAGK